MKTQIVRFNFEVIDTADRTVLGRFVGAADAEFFCNSGEQAYPAVFEIPFGDIANPYSTMTGTAATCAADTIGCW